MSSLSVIVPNYNGQKFIRGTVDRILDCLPGVKVVVVDDCSSDGSLGVLSGASAHVIRRVQNGGFAAAVNSGLKSDPVRQSKVVLVANSDIEMEPAVATEVLQWAQKLLDTPRLGVVGFREKGVKESREISGFLFLLKVGLTDRIGYFDEDFFMYGEEQDYFRRVRAAGFEIQQSGVEVGHRGEGSAPSRLKNSWLAIRNSLLLEAKNGRKGGLLRKGVVLFLIINYLYLRAEKEDPSVKRLRRPGVLMGNSFLLAALFWNAGWIAHERWANRWQKLV